MQPKGVRPTLTVLQKQKQNWAPQLQNLDLQNSVPSGFIITKLTRLRRATLVSVSHDAVMMQQ